MAFNKWQDVEARLANPAPLSEEEIRDLFPWMNLVGETAMRRLVLQDLRALQNFERSSSKLTRVLIWLTIILVILTVVIACYTIVLAHKEPSAPVSPFSKEGHVYESIHLGEVWAASALIIGFQLLSFSWRLFRELDLMRLYRKTKEPNWFPLADYLNLLSMLVLIFTVFVYPSSELDAALGLGLSLILLAGYPFAILGHYKLYKNASPIVDRPYCTEMEGVFVVLTIAVALCFVLSHHLNWRIPGILILIVALLVFVGWLENKIIRNTT